MRFFLCLLLLVGCGDGDSYDDRPAPVDPSPPGPSPKPSEWTAVVKPIVDEQCATAGCHAGAAFVQTGAAFKASNARVRISNDSMPKRQGPNFGLYNATKKKILLDYLK